MLSARFLHFALASDDRRNRCPCDMKKSTSALVLLHRPHSSAPTQPTAKTRRSHRCRPAVLHELMDTPDQGLPDSIASHATCVAVIPGFKKGAFVVGAEYGQGVVTCRTGHGWSAPAFIQLTGASFGFQIGGESTDLVLVAVPTTCTAPAARQAQTRRRCRRSRRPRRPRLPGLHHRTRQRLASSPTRATRESSPASTSPATSSTRTTKTPRPTTATMSPTRGSSPATSPRRQRGPLRSHRARALPRPRTRHQVTSPSNPHDERPGHPWCPGLFMSIASPQTQPPSTT